MLNLLTKWSEKLRAKHGWGRYATAFFYGAMTALAFPPFNAIPVLWICFPALFFLLQGASNLRKAFAVGWSFAFGLLVVSLYWIAGSLFVDIKTFWWAVPLSVAGLPAVFSIYYGLAAVAAKRWGLSRFDGIIMLSLFWFLADYARGTLFTGFPWDIMGYVWGDILPVIQITSVIGIYGLTLLTIVLVFLPATLFVSCKKSNGSIIFISSLILLGLIAAWGGWRLNGASDEVVADVRLRLVQPNFNQAMKWKNEVREANFQKMLDLTFAPAEKPITHYIWPETAVAYYLTEEPEKRFEIAMRMAKGSSLITGIVRRQFFDTGKVNFYNSIIAIDDKARVTAGYDKFHLVPFGEYMPFRSIIPIPAVAGMGSDFSFGEGTKTMRVAGLPPFSPLVCYEIIFSGDVVNDTDLPQFLLNVTNDAWYEGTTGPYQHFSISRVRAIEEGLPLVRVANKGITGVTDPYGRIIVDIGLDKADFIDSYLPKALTELTMFAKYRALPVWAVFCLFLTISVFFRLKSTKSC